MPSSVPLVLLHGWSDNSTSFHALADWLKAQGFQVVDIFLVDYLSMNDEITLFDLGYAMRLALEHKGIAHDRHSFDLIVHSTGGLVAREYLRQKCKEDDGSWNAALSPIRHLAMLAPANFGSALAKLGKSVLGRFLKGWSWGHFFETGQHVLDALELAAPYSYDLALDDLFNPAFRIFAPENTLLTVMVGTVPYDSPLQSVLYENGSDNTVRVSTANLNASHYTVDFPSANAEPKLVAHPFATADLALAVFHRNHTTIHDPSAPDLNGFWKETLLRALQIDPGEYSTHVQRCAEITATTYREGQQSPHPEWYHQCQHVVFRVHDQFGAPITDYVVEFYDDDPNDRAMEFIHKTALTKTTVNQVDASYRSFFIDITALDEYLAKNPNTKISLSISAVAISKRIIIDYPQQGFAVFTKEDGRFRHPNQPVLVDVTLHREPNVTSDDDTVNIFRLNKY